MNARAARQQSKVVIGDFEARTKRNHCRRPQAFFASKQRYEELGIPWRRGYLLFGTPGTGKTSLVTALASDLSLNACALRHFVGRHRFVFPPKAKSRCSGETFLIRLHQRAGWRRHPRRFGGVSHHQSSRSHRRRRHPLNRGFAASGVALEVEKLKALKSYDLRALFTSALQD